ncbi:hypothetical protein ACIB24_20450 [Spongisporangium articulatum]|uniref:Secreted protein n=1 Tax=Spongisporangium articulatum TaxID=3362603 RepID=A0ABW8AUY1_9ACTN
MDPIYWLVVLVVALVAIGVLLLVTRQRQRQQLQHRFGPEYDRAVERTGDPRAAERELRDVAQRRDALDIHELDEDSRQRWTRDWGAVQTYFVDSPAEAVASASALVTSVMRERGYPVDDFDERAALVAADHPDVVQHYRDAQAAYDRHRESGLGDTEDLRQSFVHYRALFVALVHPSDDTRETPATTVRGDAVRDDSVRDDSVRGDAVGEPVPDRTDRLTDRRPDEQVDGRTDDRLDEQPDRVNLTTAEERAEARREADR